MEFVGKSIPRIDAFDKVTGRARYTADLAANFPRMLQIKALRSPYAHAKLLRLDIEKALAIPGVADIVTAETPGIPWDSFSPQSRIVRGEAIWAGQAVAYIAAESTEIAQQAVEAITVEYEALPHVLDWRTALADEPVSIVDPQFIHRERDARCEYKSPNVVGEYHLRNGDADAAMADADVVREDVFWAGKKTHCQIERATAIAEYSDRDGITVWCNGCGVHDAIKTVICDAFQIKWSRLRIIQPYIGGAFGGRNLPYVEFVAVLMALRTKRTVMAEYSRKEMFTAAPSNWACVTRVKLGVKKDGTFVSKDMMLTEELGAYAGKSAFTGRLSASATANMYRFPSMKLDTYAVLTNTVPAGSYRGLGTPDAVFGIETLLNELSADLGLSPVDIRLKNILTKGEINDYGERVVAIGVAECLKAVAKAIEVDEAPVQDDPVWIKGRGVACAGKQNSPSDAGRAEVWLHSDGSVEVFFSSDNQGMGASTVMAQIVAEELKTEISNIKCTISDTARTPYDNQSSSSRAVYLTGNAVKRACEDLIRQIQTEAGRKMNVVPEMIRMAGGQIHVTGAVIESFPVTELFTPFTYFAQNLYGPRKGTPLKGLGIFAPPPIVPWDENGRTPKMWNWYQYAAAAVEIAVNIKTGQIKVLRLASAADTGNPLNPKIVEQQIEGGAHMAIGFFLNEEHLYDKNGAIGNAAFNDYRLPMVFEMPKNDDVISLICPDPQPDGPYGAKGMSESVTCAIGPAITGALYRMFGIRIRSFPMTAERILAALEAAGKAGV